MRRVKRRNQVTGAKAKARLVRAVAAFNSEYGPAATSAVLAGLSVRHAEAEGRTRKAWLEQCQSISKHTPAIGGPRS